MYLFSFSFGQYEEHQLWNKTCFCFLKDPFLLISKVVEGGIQIPICKTEVIKNDLNPMWKPVFLSIQQVGGKVDNINTIVSFSVAIFYLKKLAWPLYFYIGISSFHCLLKQRAILILC